MLISSRPPQVGLPVPAKAQRAEHQGPTDEFEPGALKKGLHVAAGAVGSVVGGTLGLVPGVGLGVRRMLSDSETRPSLRDHMAACDAGDMWGVSYGLLGVGLTLAASAVLNTTPIQNVAMLALAVPAAMAPQSIFRMLSRSTARAAQADTFFPSNVAYCADAHMSAETSNPINGAMSGIRHGARQGKLALQDLLVPSMKPNDSTYYGHD